MESIYRTYFATKCGQRSIRYLLSFHFNPNKKKTKKKKGRKTKWKTL